MYIYIVVVVSIYVMYACAHACYFMSVCYDVYACMLCMRACIYVCVVWMYVRMVGYVCE